MPHTRETFLAPQYAPGHHPEVKRVRSTLLAASLQSVRHMGWEDRYFAALPSEHHDEMRMLTAGVWMPIALGIAHYTACDGMAVSNDEIKEAGRQVSLRTQKTFVGTLGSIAAGAGATPWHIFQHGHRIWGRIFDGGDHGSGPRTSTSSAWDALCCAFATSGRPWARTTPRSPEWWPAPCTGTS